MESRAVAARAFESTAGLRRREGRPSREPGVERACVRRAPWMPKGRAHRRRSVAIFFAERGAGRSSTATRQAAPRSSTADRDAAIGLEFDRLHDVFLRDLAGRTVGVGMVAAVAGSGLGAERHGAGGRRHRRRGPCGCGAAKSVFQCLETPREPPVGHLQRRFRLQARGREQGWRSRRGDRRALGGSAWRLVERRAQFAHPSSILSTTSAGVGHRNRRTRRACRSRLARSREGRDRGAPPTRRGRVPVPACSLASITSHCVTTASEDCAARRRRAAALSGRPARVKTCGCRRIGLSAIESIESARSNSPSSAAICA